MLILKQNAANTVPTPPAGKGTIFLDDSDTLSVKTSDGNVENFPTVAASNSQVVFMNGTALSGEAAFTYDFNNNILTVSGNIAAGNVKTDNLLYSNGVPWDLSDPGGSNTQIQFNDDESFGGSGAFTFNKSSNLVTVGANLDANNLNATTHITAGNVWANAGTISAQTLKGEGGNISNVTAGNITGQVANALVAGTVYTAAQPNITSVGTLSSLAVTGNVTAGNVYSNSGTIGANLLTGTLTTAAQPNITSVGTLTNLNVSGNAIISGNLTVDGNLVYVNVESVAVEDPIIQLQTGPNGAAPSSNSGKDVGSALNYYDSQARIAFMGWDVSNAEFGLASLASITNEVVTFSTYGNLRAGVYFGNAAGLTNVPGGNIVGNISGNISNATHAVTSNTVVDAAQPNITSVGTLTSVSVTGNVVAGNVYANSGTIGAGTLKGEGGNISNITAGNITGQVANSLVAGTVYTNAQPNITSVGTLSSVAITGNATAGNVYANSGTIGASLLTGTLTTAAQPNITSVGTLSSLTVSGNISAGGVKTDNLYYANGNAWDLSDPGGGNTAIQFNDDESFGGSAAFTFNKSSNLVTISANLDVNNVNATNYLVAGNVFANTGTIGASLLTGTLTTAAQPNITSVGTLSSLTVTGNATAGNVYANSGTIGASLLTGTLTTAAQPNITSVGTLTTVAITGNATAGNVYANSGTIGASILKGEGGNISNVTAGNITGQVANALVAGTVYTAAQPNITSVGTLSSLSVTGNASAGNVNAGNLLTANYVTGTLTTAAQPNITSVGTLTGLSVDGSNITLANGVYVGNGSGLSALAGANVTGQVGNALVAGTVYTAAQPNITSVGTLSSLTVSGNANVGNLGTAQVLATANITAPQLISNIADGTAPLIVTSTTKVANLNADLLDGYSTATAATANTVVIRDANGSFSANIITGTLTGAATTAGTVTTAAQPNITSVGTLSSVAVTGNGTFGNVYANSGTVGASLLTGTLTTAAQPNITSVGTLTGLGVNGNITAANITANTGVFTGNGSGLSALAGANVTGQVGNALVAGTVYTNAQPNITSVGTLSSLAVTGNATAGNVYANSGTIGASLLTGTLTTAAQPNITSTGTLTSLTVTGNVAAGNLTTTGVLSVTGTGVSSIAGNLDMTSNNIINLATPVNSSDAATKQYVDDVAQGLNVHDSVAAATSGTLATATGGTITYNNGSSGVGATLTTTGSYTTIDGVNVATVGTRILVKNEANAAHNGIYTYTSSTVITRATDFNTVPEVEAGDFVFVTGGTLYDNTGWVQTDTVATIGTDSINFTQFSGAGTYQAGTGLTLTGSTFSVNASQTQITSVGTLSGLNVNGTVTASAFTANTGVFTGNGSGLSALAGGNVTGQVANALVAGTVYTNAQPNITSVGTLSSLAVTGTTTSGNFATAGNITASFLVSNVATGTAPLTVTSTTRVANLNVAYANVADNINVTTQSSGNAYLLFGNALTGNIAETANASFVANTSNGALYATTFVGALSGAATSATTAGTVTTAAQPNITSVGTLTGLGVNGTVTAVAFTANTGVFTGNGSGLSAIAGANVTGQVGNALIAGTVYTAAQGNITSVGTLTSLNVSGNITAPNLIANTGFVISSVNAAVSAAGTVQGNATALSRELNVTSTVASGAGVALPTAVAGMRVTIINTAANAVLVYPASGGTINSLAQNAAFSQAAGARLDFVATSTTQWYTLNATYA